MYNYKRYLTVASCVALFTCFVCAICVFVELSGAMSANESLLETESACKETESELVVEKSDKKDKFYSLQRQEAVDLGEIISEQDVQIMSVTENFVTYVKDENSKVFNLKYNTIDLIYGDATKPKVRITINDTSKYVLIDAYLPGSVMVYKSHE